MTDMTATEAIQQGVYGFYLAERARQLGAELDALMPPGCTSLDGMALAAWAGRAGVTLSLIAEELAGPLPEMREPTIHDCDSQAGRCFCGPDPAAELPWLGDIDRRADDDVEFCIEGEDV